MAWEYCICSVLMLDHENSGYVLITVAYCGSYWTSKMFIGTRKKCILVWEALKISFSYVLSMALLGMFELVGMHDMTLS